MDSPFIDRALSGKNEGDDCSVFGRISSVRKYEKTIFFDLTDTSGGIQVVVNRDDSVNGAPLHLTVGSYVSVNGNLIKGHQGSPEIRARSLEVLAAATLPVSPSPWRIDALDHRFGKQVFDFTEIYLANPQRAAVLSIKSSFLRFMHEYFHNNRFTLVDPPILTDKTLYDNSHAISARVNDETVFLSQCATFELEPLAMVFNKVYTISPAFRNESSGSKRHLTEYTHIKAEALLMNLDDLMFLAGDSLHSALERTVSECGREFDLLRVNLDLDGLNPKNQIRMSYDEAIKITHILGSNTEYGKGLTRRDEIHLSNHVGGKYFWVQFPPFQSEGFPYRRKPGQPHLSMVCDLIAPHGAGEMVGVAEKTHDAEELIQNIIEKGKKEDIHRYWGYILLRKYGMPPHGGLGAAPERILYGLLGLDHIRLTKPWPRYPDRKIKSSHSDLNPWKDADLERLIKKYDLH